MNSYAIIETGSKQYKVENEDTLRVERINKQVGEEIKMDNVLAFSDGKQLRLGTPKLDNVEVTASVIKHIRGPKVVSYKKKRRLGYHRKQGHRQELTVLKIINIQ
jgi:large subunit ribosomal protein L21